MGADQKATESKIARIKVLMSKLEKVSENWLFSKTHNQSRFFESILLNLNFDWNGRTIIEKFPSL